MTKSTKPERRRQRVVGGSPKEVVLNLVLSRKKRFLDTWWKLHPVIYNKFFDLTGGDGAEMVETLLIERPKIFNKLMGTLNL